MDLLKQIDREIESVETEREAARDAHAQAKSHWRDLDRSLSKRLTQLRRARSYVAGGSPYGGTTRKAGQAAMERVTEFVKDRGRATQAEIAKETGLGSGHVSYAVRALEDAGVLQDTGKRVGRSREVEYVEHSA